MENWVSYLSVDDQLDALLGHGYISSTSDWWVKAAIRASRKFLFVALGFLIQSLSISQPYSCLSCATRTDLLESFSKGNPIYSNRSFVAGSWWILLLKQKKGNVSFLFAFGYFLLFFYLLLSPCRKSKLLPQVNLLSVTAPWSLGTGRVHTGTNSGTCLDWQLCCTTVLSVPARQRASLTPINVTGNGGLLEPLGRQPWHAQLSKDHSAHWQRLLREETQAARGGEDYFIQIVWSHQVTDLRALYF